MPFTPLEINNNSSTGGLKNFSSSTPPPQVTPTSIISKIGNLYKSQFGIANDLKEGATKGILSTVKGLGQVGEKIGNAILPKSLEFPGAYSDPNLDANKAAGGTMGNLFSKESLTPKNTTESIGKAAEQIAEFFIPAGKVAEVEKLVSGGAKALTLEKLAPIVGEKT